VFAGDVAKGSAAVSVAGLLDLPAWVALPVAGAAILGHWRSVFTGFRGGDGMATLMGITVTLEPALSALGIGVALLVLPALWRAPLRSSAALLTGFAVIVGASQHYQADRGMVAGLAGLATLVLLHTLAAKWRRRMNAARPEPAGGGAGQANPGGRRRNGVRLRARTPARPGFS
jgi:glycerol-3-phosphate acyltransferase PlsY